MNRRVCERPEIARLLLAPASLHKGKGQQRVGRISWSSLRHTRFASWPVLCSYPTAGLHKREGQQRVDFDRTIDIIGFSRGAATTLDFCHKIQEQGIRAPGSQTAIERNPKIRFLGVWDGAGRNLAPGGAQEVRIDARTGRLLSFR